MEASLLTAYIALGIFAVIPIYFGARASLHYPEDIKRKVGFFLDTLKRTWTDLAGTGQQKVGVPLL